MGRSFFYGTELRLYLGSKSFLEQIGEAPETFGLSQAQVDDYAIVVEAYSIAYRAWAPRNSRTAAKVVGKNHCKLALRRATARLAKIIDGTESVSDARKLDLGLALQRTGGPGQTPGTPVDFTVELSAIGSIMLKWKCHHPGRASGVIYLVSRRIDGDGAFVPLGFSGKKRFVDCTIPPGTIAATYRVQAVRSNAAGNSTDHRVQFSPIGMSAAMIRSTVGPMQHAA